MLGCTAAVIWPTGLGNFDKNCLANLATELLTHSVQMDYSYVFKCVELHPRSRKKGKANVFKGGVFKTSSK